MEKSTFFLLLLSWLERRDTKLDARGLRVSRIDDRVRRSSFEWLLICIWPVLYHPLFSKSILFACFKNGFVRVILFIPTPC